MVGILSTMVERRLSLMVTIGFVVLGLAACEGGSTSGSPAATPTAATATPTAATATPTTAPVSCMSGKSFSYQAGACVEGTGAVYIGPFTTHGPWGVSVKLSGQSDTGDDCASLAFALVAGDKVSGLSNIALGTGTGTFSISMPARMRPQTNAKWYVRLDPANNGQASIINGCSWTATFS
jgi:hypothetical protein